MNENVPIVPNIDFYHNQFRNNSQSFRHSPAINRACNDKVCFVLFLLITGTFLGLGYYFIHASNIKIIVNAELRNKYDYTSLQNLKIQNIKYSVPIVMGVMALATILSAAFLCVMARLPQCTFFLMLAVGFLSLVALTGIFFYIRAYLPAIILAIIVCFVAFIIFCSFQKISKGLPLLSISNRILIARPSIFVAPFFVLIFAVTFFSFWAMGFAGIVIYKGNASTQAQMSDQKLANIGMALVFKKFYLFFAIFFYLCLNFIISTAIGTWYYNTDENYLPRAVARILRFHLGSLTFVTLLIGIVSLVRRHFQSQSPSAILSCCLCCITCCLQSMEHLLQTLNHNAVTTMSVTGQGYFDSARSTLSLIYEKYPLFFLVDLVSHLVIVAGTIFIGGVSGIVGFVLLRTTAENPEQTTIQMIGTIVTTLYGFLVGAIFMSTISQTLTSAFIFFCLDQKFQQMGYSIHDSCPQQIKNVFTDMLPYVGGEYNPHYAPVPVDRNSNRPPINNNQDNQHIGSYRRSFDRF